MEQGIYSNAKEHYSQEPADNTGIRGPQADTRSNQQRVYRRVCFIFGLLCLLQVTLNVMLRLHAMNVGHSSLAEDQDLQLNYTHLQKELERATNECQMKYNSLVEERDHLWTNYTKLAEQRDRIRKTLDALKAGWKSFQHNLYLFSTEKKNWDGAREDCRQREADLVIINSQEEQDFISTHLHETWIGLTDTQREGHWKWVDGTPLTNGLWMAKEPNDANNGEDCAKAFGRQWNDQECSLLFKWTCESEFDFI